jgi:type IV pilus assembly protein PilN
MLNGLFDEKAFSWTLTMESLETVLPGGVQVSTLEPVRAKDGHITLRMRVIGPRDKGIEFVRNLEHSHRFLTPRIVGETAENASGPGQNMQPVSDTNRFSFDLVADYNPPSTDEVKAAGGEDTGTAPEGRKRPGAEGAVRRPSRDTMPAAPHTRTREEYKRPAGLSKPNPGQTATPGGGR